MNHWRFPSMLSFLMHCFVSKPERLKFDQSRKSRPNFGSFDHVKIWGAVNEMFSEFHSLVYELTFDILLIGHRSVV